MTASLDYESLFTRLRDTLLDKATCVNRAELERDPATVSDRRELVLTELADAQNRVYTSNLSDQQFWDCLVMRPFYANRKVKTIRKHEPAIQEALKDWRALTPPGWSVTVPRNGSFRAGSEAMAFLKSRAHLRAPGALSAVVYAAAVLRRRRRHSSATPLLRMFVDAHQERFSHEDLKDIHAGMNGDAGLGLGLVTTFHFVMELGLPVVKPDKVLIRLVARLGLIREYTKASGRIVPIPSDPGERVIKKLQGDPDFCWELQRQFAVIAEKTNHSMRALDLILVKLGQQAAPDMGYVRTICDDTPTCDVCGGSGDCRYYQERHRRR